MLVDIIGQTFQQMIQEKTRINLVATQGNNDRFRDTRTYKTERTKTDPTDPLTIVFY